MLPFRVIARAGERRDQRISCEAQPRQLHALSSQSRGHRVRALAFPRWRYSIL
jgi:hypothetical protein